jgi:hypothetical protein
VFFTYVGGVVYVTTSQSAAVADQVSTTTMLFVSPSGSDTNSGTIDRPFKTLDHARDVVRTLTPTMTSDITVYLRGGRYQIDHTFTLSPQDSGMNGKTVIYSNYPGEHPVLTGSNQVTGWTLWQNGIWRTNVGVGVDSRQMYVNGAPAVRARAPGVPAGFVKTATGFKTTMPMVGWKNIGDMEMVSRNATGWRTYRCPIQSASAGSVVVQGPCWGFTQNDDNPPLVILNSVSWLENSLSFLDAPGEWYLDKTTGFIYYKPRTGETMNTASVVLPKTQTLVSGIGTAGAPVHNLTFKGIIFTETTWLGPNSNIGFAERQADTYFYEAGNIKVTKMIPASVSFDFVESVNFLNDTFARLGAAGLALDHAKNNVIAWSTFVSISGNGIIIGNGTDLETPNNALDPALVTSGNNIYDNSIHNVANEYEGGVGIWLGFTQNSLVRNNELYNLPYTGISVGWGGPGIADPTGAGGTIIKANYIHDYMQVLHDGGGIYSLLAQPGNVYTQNVILRGTNSNGGLYLDNVSRYIEVSNNIVLDNMRSAIIKGGNHNVHDNYWQNRYANDIWWYNDPVPCIPTDCGPNTITANHVITALNQAPQAILNAAGIEKIGNPYLAELPPTISTSTDPIATTTPPIATSTPPIATSTPPIATSTPPDTGTTTPPSSSPPVAKSAPSWDFGGMYGYGASGINNNSATGAASCPSGYLSRRVYGTSGTDWPVFICYRAHVEGQETFYDFGGMYGSGNGVTYTNPITSGASCPMGYSSSVLLNTSGTDWPLRYCYKRHIAGEILSYNFGGVYGSGGGGVVYENPITSASSCPQGYSVHKVHGTAGTDWPLYFCYK